MTLILASGSRTRLAMLVEAGLEMRAVTPDLDERAAEAPLREAGLGGADIAMVLAEAKALSVGPQSGALVVAADQTLTCEGRRFDKPADMAMARRQLLALRGRTHTLHSALAVARDGEVVFSHLDEAHLAMRDFTPAFLGRYLAAIGDEALASVGGYRLEGRGVQLFDRIEGDYFTILGLPLLPLLAFLRGEGVIDT